jgi:hypothetical protein
MDNKPSFKGIGSANTVTLRTTPKSTESSVSTQHPTNTTPSPRGHA